MSVLRSVEEYGHLRYVDGRGHPPQSEQRKSSESPLFERVVTGAFERFFKLASAAALVLAPSPGSAGAAESAPSDFVYQLQRIDLQAIGNTKFDLVIMDYSRDGSDAEKFTAAPRGR
jgi:endo-alpha-1,4-polygalactosaminidase (GH114 family)